MNNPYFIYILECRDNTFYTGITTNLERRLQEHQQGIGAKYTRGRGPFILRYVEEVPDRSSATKRERQIKALSRQEKFHLIKEMGIGYVSSKEL